MKVVCIFPVTNKAENIPHIIKSFEKEVAPGLCFFGAINPEIKFAGTDYVYVANNCSLEGKPKGRGILDSLKNMSKPPDFVIVCDGSGKIPYKYIVDVFQELTSDSSSWCVMANRTNNKAISQARYLIERFEIYSLKQCHNHTKEIPDGQCGLWGFRFGKFNDNGIQKEIKLSGEGYEIELDLLSEILSKKINYSFINVELPEAEVKTSFRSEDNIKKMKFLMKKYTPLNESITNYIKSFEQTQEFSYLCSDEKIASSWVEYKSTLLKNKSD